MFNKINSYLTKAYSSKGVPIAVLVLIKLLFQIVVVKSGLRWLTADDYSRTVISWDWLQHPRIYSGVWLSFHFWLNGIFIWLFKDLTLSPVIANTLFSVLTLVYLYKIIEKVFPYLLHRLSEKGRARGSYLCDNVPLKQMELLPSYSLFKTGGNALLE